MFAQPRLDENGADEKHEHRREHRIEHRPAPRLLITDEPFADLNDKFEHGAFSSLGAF